MPRPARALCLCVALAALSISSLSAADNVARHGRLQVEGNRIVGSVHGEPVSLAGMSLFWSQWMGQYYNAETLAWLKSDWNITIVRAPLGVHHEEGYLQDPATERARIKTVVDAAIAQDLYVVIDWHDHHAEDHAAEAAAFFADMSQTYGDSPHVIYEIYNEPLRVSWAKTVKPYAETVIAAIRAHDPDNLIIVGTPFWSQRVDEAAADPLADPNVAYALHFYAGSHQGRLRSRATKALRAGIALFVTEWGTVNANGDGAVDRKSVAAWMKFLRRHHISHLNWSVSNKAEGAAILKPDVATLAGWTDNDLTDSGRFVRDLIRTW